MKYTTATFVKRAREHARLTQKQLAEKLSVNPNTVAGWEQGRHQPALEELSRIAGICHVRATFVLGGDADGVWEVHPQDSDTNMCSLAGLPKVMEGAR